MRRGYKKRGRRKKARATVKHSRKVRVKRPVAKVSSRRHKLPATALMSRDLCAKHDPSGAWMILEVNDDGENLYDRYELLESELIRIFGEEVQFFIPAYIEKIKDKIVGVDLIGGYLFVEKKHESESAIAVMTSPYIKGRMAEGGRSGFITGANINEYKKKMLDYIKNMAPKKGSLVIPKVGTFKNLEGKVVSVARDRKSATVMFKRSSRVVTAPVSVINMDPVSGAK
jgi:transcription antitermination factor NusG